MALFIHINYTNFHNHESSLTLKCKVWKLLLCLLKHVSVLGLVKGVNTVASESVTSHLLTQEVLPHN